MQGIMKKKFKVFKRNVEAINRRSGSEKVLFAIVFFIFAIQALTMFFVFWWLLNNSLKDPFEYGKLKNSMNLPEEFLFGNYLEAFKTLNTEDVSFFEMIANNDHHKIMVTCLIRDCPFYLTNSQYTL